MTTTVSPSGLISRWLREMTCCGLSTAIRCGRFAQLALDDRGRRPMITVRSSVTTCPVETLTRPVVPGVTGSKAVGASFPNGAC
jgi:hypothetical protein